MIRHVSGVIAAIAFVILCTVLPFLPGGYDSLAVPLSAMAQIVGTLGLVVVPFGLLWVAADRWQRLAQSRFVFVSLSLIASTLVSAGLSLGAILHSGFALGALVVVLSVYAVSKAWLKFKQARGTTPLTSTSTWSSAVPFYLITVPVAVALFQFAFVDRAIEFSRNRAILNSSPLIATLEQHRATNGRYPTSLQSVWPDYQPNIIGIREYSYAPHGDSYNLFFFEQFTYRFGTREFVMYNPRDEHVMTAHATDILELTPQQLALERTRGHYARHDLPQPHWKLFWFD
ncbi:MAG TPA: hypothetical protein VFO72_11110 [Pyrinomonadaceae bacterium]|nr:hypothetical protein [Pyrinomonadaceae bacterium]